uniref:RING-type domain-containing protein n=1 Tax=Chelydra serpentina TaxID=8475 RepID=A0A8C3RYD2_CHESE
HNRNARPDGTSRGHLVQPPHAEAGLSLPSPSLTGLFSIKIRRRGDVQPLGACYQGNELCLLILKEHEPIPVYHPTPSQTRLATQLTEEEQIRIAQRIGLIQHLPKGIFDPGIEPSEKKVKECVICMLDFVYGDPIRFLPCLHIYHVHCIDDWLMRSFTCPSCMEPVDAALLASYYETN